MTVPAAAADERISDFSGGKDVFLDDDSTLIN